MEKIEYDINFLINDRELFKIFYWLLNTQWEYKNISEYNEFLTYSEDEFYIHIFQELKIWGDSIKLYFSRSDIWDFQIIIRKFDDLHTCVRIALTFDLDYINNDYITSIVFWFLNDFYKFTHILCMTSWEATIPYFINEIKNLHLEWEFLYLDKSFIREDLLIDDWSYHWLYYGNWFLFPIQQRKDIPLWKVLR